MSNIYTTSQQVPIVARNGRIYSGDSSSSSASSSSVGGGGSSMTYPTAGIAVSTGTAWGTSITDSSASWNSAYGWGNHASAGYATTAWVSSQGFVTGTPWTGYGYVTGTPWTGYGYWGSSSHPTTLSGYGITDGSTLAIGTTSGTACAGNDSRLTDARTPTSHTHGNITNAGAIGASSGLPIITTTSGVLTAGSFGTTAGTFAQGNDSRLSDSRTASDVYAWAKASVKPTYTAGEVGAAGLASPTFTGTVTAPTADITTLHMKYAGSTYWTIEVNGSGDLVFKNASSVVAMTLSQSGYLKAKDDSSAFSSI